MGGDFTKFSQRSEHYKGRPLQFKGAPLMFQGDARESKGPRPRPSVPSSLPLSCYVQQHICKVLAEMLDAFATYLWSACRNFRKGRSTTRRAARDAPYSLRGRPLCLRQTQGKPRDPVPVRPSLPPFPFPVMSS